MKTKLLMAKDKLVAETSIDINTNFHQVTKSSVFDVRDDEKFKEYRHRWKEYPRNWIVGEYPIHLDIESTSVCNLRCPFCATTHKHWGSSKNGIMKNSIYRNIVDESMQYGLFSVKLSLRGEPLMHPNIVEMVRYAKKAGIIDVYFNTNAMLLNENIINQLIDSGLDRISISAEGFTSEVYERYRSGAKFKMLLENVERLLTVREKRGVKNPQVRIQTVLTDEMKHILPDYVKFWEKLADEVSYLDYRDEKPGTDHRGKIGEWACPFLWQRMTILWDGTLLPCLMHGVKDFSTMVLGVIPDVSIKEKWLCERTKQIRLQHKEGEAHLIEACNQCSYREMELKKLREIKNKP